MSGTRKSPDEIAQELADNGISICENFIDIETTLELRSDIARLKSEAQFHRAGVGHGPGFGIRDTVRRDEIHWLAQDGANEIQKFLLAELDLLKTAFNRGLYLGLNQFEGHYATYEPGGFYQRHLDAFGDTSLEGKSRVVSVVLYLNDSWHPSDGGELRLYLQNSHRDIAPVGGTLVCFLSRETEHEVLPSAARRVSFTGWFGRGMF